MAKIDEIININSSWSKTISLTQLDNSILKVWIYSGVQGDGAIGGVSLLDDNDRPLEATYTLNGRAVTKEGSRVCSFVALV